MKKAMLFLALTTALTSNAFAVGVPGGTVNFHGEVVDAACTVAADSVNQHVYLGQVKPSDFVDNADAGKKQEFRISLVDCDAATPTTVKLSFTGTTVPNAENDIMANTAPNGAAGVGLRMYDKDSIPVPIDGSGFTSAQDVLAGATTIPLFVDYVNIGVAADVTPGPVESVATFNVVYE
ncbi:S-fimbrial protein subunit SfaA precursor [compost metagenome]